MITKKEFKQILNVKFKNSKWINGKRYGQKTRQYGDYLYTQDPVMFNNYYNLYLKGEF